MKGFPMHKTASTLKQYTNNASAFKQIQVEGVEGDNLYMSEEDKQKLKKFQEETIADPAYTAKDFVSSFSERKARFVKVKAKNVGICPEWHPGSGNRGWLFVDEIVIN